MQSRRRRSTGAPNELTSTSVVTLSWGETNDIIDPLWDSYTLESAMLGITILGASGDNGSDYNLEPFNPTNAAYDTYGTIAVGGTVTTLSGTQSQDGSGTTGISSQIAWQDSQGGVSDNYSIPIWQYNSQDAYYVIFQESQRQNIIAHRATPDIAAIAENMNYYFAQQYWPTGIAGTSIASPLVAGEVASMNHFLKSKEGFFAPTIYQLGQNQYWGEYPSSMLPFSDVTTGSNYNYSARIGYDLVTGWGSINAYNFVILQNQPRIITPLGNSNEYSDFTFKASVLAYQGIKSISFYVDSTNIYSVSNPTQTDFSTTVIFNDFSYGWHNLWVHVVNQQNDPISSNLISVNFVQPSSGGGCLYKNTNILMSDGISTKKVQSLEAGDWILGFNETTHLFTPVLVDGVTVTKVASLLSINDGELIVTRYDQPIYIRNSTYVGWVRNPIQLLIGDEMYRPIDSSWVVITDLSTISNNNPIYNVYDVITSPIHVIVANGYLIDPYKL